MDSIFDDPELLRVFQYMYYAHFAHPENMHEMYSSDLLMWLLTGIDAKLTGEFNGAIAAAKDPKVKPKIPNPLRVEDGETFFKRAGIIPKRYENQIDQYRKATAPVKKAEKKSLIDNMKAWFKKDQARA